MKIRSIYILNCHPSHKRILSLPLWRFHISRISKSPKSGQNQEEGKNTISKSISKTNEARQNIYVLDISFPLFFNISFQATILQVYPLEKDRYHMI